MENIEKRLEAIEKAIAEAAIAAKEILTISEAAVFMGITKGTLYHLTSEQRIPHYKPTGKTCYFKRTELETWLLQNRVSIHTELEMQAQTICMHRNKK